MSPILSRTWRPNNPDLNPVDCAIWGKAWASLPRQEVWHRWPFEAGDRAGVTRTATALHWSQMERRLQCTVDQNGGHINNNNNNTWTMFIVLSTWKSLREFTRFIWRMQGSANWPPTFRPSQPTWAVSPPVGCRNPPSPYYYYSAWKLLLILPSHGGWKAEST